VIHLAASLLLTLPLAGPGYVEPVVCSSGGIADTIHLDGVAHEPLAVVGSRWWIPRFVADGSERFPVSAALTLEEEISAESLVLTDLWETPAAISIPVPADASPGETYLLRADGQAIEELRVAVGDLVTSDAVLTDVEVVAGGPQGCLVQCAVDGLTVPATPRLRFTHVGGPMVLDVFVVPEGWWAGDELARRVDSYALGAASSPTMIEIDLDELGISVALDVTVRARDPGDLTVLHDEYLAVAPLDQLPADTEGVPACGAAAAQPEEGCAFFGGSSIALLFAPILALRLRRLRRRSTSPS